jgi:peptidyl-prolyl cis-trans isomerase A (cyclophilin A)
MIPTPSHPATRAPSSAAPSRAAGRLGRLGLLSCALAAGLAVQACGGGDDRPLFNPRSAAMNQAAPDSYRVQFSTSRGDFTVQVHREWAPRGADRFYNLVRHGFYDDVRFFRVIRDPRPFMVQFGISGDPAVSARWSDATLEDDPVKVSNTRGRITFATAGPNSRTTQVFINYGNNPPLDRMGFAPFGEVVSGMDVVDALHAEYGEGAPEGDGPDQQRIEAEGTAYLAQGWPRLDYVRTARIVE